MERYDIDSTYSTINSNQAVLNVFFLVKYVYKLKKKFMMS